MASLFGTDGIRGAFGEPPLNEDTVRRVGYHLGVTLARSAADAGMPRVVIGGDTRDSTPTLERWLVDGLASAGAGVTLLGVAPTPAVAHVVRRTGADAGIVVSASHNRHPDNGIKLIGRDGYKWLAEAEAALEERLLAAAGDALAQHSRQSATLRHDLLAEYLDHILESTTGGMPLDGQRLAIDCANGAASPLARELFERLGAEVSVTGNMPDGRNINEDCGATCPECVAELVTSSGSDLGMAFDGDADRVILSDESGKMWDGDAILFMWAKALADAGQLEPRAVVATTMSNLGLERALAIHSIDLIRCDVGDRAVVETLREHGLVLGGESSGHIVNLDLSTTGDGLLTAVQIAWLVRRSGQALSALLQGFRRYPQILRNVAVGHKQDFDTVDGLAEVVASIHRRLGSEGRLLLRYSGTEPVARVMIEGPDNDLVRELADQVVSILARQLGGPYSPND